VKASKSPNAWYLDLPKSWNIKQLLNTSLFKRDNSDPTPNRFPPPVKQSIHGAEHLVENVVGYEDRTGNGRNPKVQRHYWLRWTGRGSDNDTWEPLLELENYVELLEEYHKKQGWPIQTWPRRSKRRVKQQKKKKKLGGEGCERKSFGIFITYKRLMQHEVMKPKSGGRKEIVWNFDNVQKAYGTRGCQRVGYN
jgi:hypothetical protein